MLKKLRQEVFLSPTLKLLEKANADKSHQFMHPKYISQITKLCNEAKSKNELLNFLSKSLKSNSISLQIKSLVILHACLKVSFDQQICDFVQTLQHHLQTQKNNKRTEKEDQNTRNYLNENAVDYYIIYLKKLTVHKDTFAYMRKFVNLNLNTEEEIISQRYDELQIVHYGFNILNFAHYLLQSQVMLSKMGRYYNEHKEFVSMYIQFLADMDLYNSYISKSSNNILKKKSFSPKPKKVQLRKKDISLKQKQQNLSQPNTQQNQKTKHFFLYISQCQKVVDRLHEFFHIRYYFKQVKSMFVFPIFLSIQQKDYRRLVRQAKCVDKNLVRQVRMSKYSKEQAHGDRLNMTLSSFNHEGKNESNVTETCTMTQIYSSKKDYVLESQFSQEDPQIQEDGGYAIEIEIENL